MLDVEDSILNAPKAELHIHIEGIDGAGADVRTRGPQPPRRSPFASVEEVRASYDFRDLQSFLDIYYAGRARAPPRAGLLRPDSGPTCGAAAAQNVRHAEIFFDPQTHTARGVPFETWSSTASATPWRTARSNLGITSKLILCFLRHLSADAAMDTLDEALRYEGLIDGGRPRLVRGRPPAREVQGGVREGARDTACQPWPTPARRVRRPTSGRRWTNCGSCGSITACGVSKTRQLVARLVAEQVPLTVCPLSNVRLRVVDTMAEHPLKRMLEAGLCVTVNSDDPAYFGGYLAENLLAAHRELGIDEDGIRRLLKNSFRASFLTAEVKEQLMGQVDNHFTGKPR